MYLGYIQCGAACLAAGKMRGRGMVAGSTGGCGLRWCLGEPFFFLLFLEKPEQAHWAGSGSSLLLLMVLCFAHWKSGQFEGNSMSVLQKIFVSLFSSLKLYWRLTVCGNWIIPLLFGRIRLRGPALALICWSLTLLVCHLYTSCCSAGMFISPREFLILCQTLLDHKGNII